MFFGTIFGVWVLNPEYTQSVLLTRGEGKTLLDLVHEFLTFFYGQFLKKLNFRAKVFLDVKIHFFV